MAPTIAFISGAVTPATNYDALRATFEAQGFPTTGGDPPSLTHDDATAVTVNDDISFVRASVIEPLLKDGKDVVLLLHSYGGTYGAAAAEGLSKKERAAKGDKGGIVGVIYAASFCTDPGETALAAIGMTGAEEGVGPGDKPGTLIFTNGLMLWPSLGAAAQDRCAEGVKPTSAAALATPVSYAPYKDPNFTDAVAYINFDQDVLLPREKADANIAKTGITNPNLLRTVKGGHGIDVEAKDDFVDEVAALVKRFAGLY